jgi:hypothetical protein
MTEILLKDELRSQKTEISQISNNSAAINVSGHSASRKRRKSQGKDSFEPYTSLSKQKTTVSAGQNSRSNNSSLVQSHLNATKDYKLPRNDASISAMIAQSNSSVNTYFAAQDQIKIERESLERIHTFSLKETNDDLDHSTENITAQLTKRIPVEGALGEIPTSKKEREGASN